MTDYKAGTPEQWLGARLELLQERICTEGDELAWRQQALPRASMGASEGG